MNAPDPIREQTVKACIDACTYSAQQCAAAADAEGPHAELLLQAARLCETVSSQLTAGDMPSADVIARTVDLCSRAAVVCESVDELAQCAAACRNSAQICLTLGQSGTSDDRVGSNGAGRANPPRGALTQRLRPDAALAEIVGSEPLTRADVTRRIWAYIKEHGLQDPHDRRRIRADERLRPVFDGSSRISMFEMSRCINRHLN